VVLSVPRRLRPFFQRNRERLARLARVAWETVKELLQDAAGDSEAVPGGVGCVQTYGNLLDFHPHSHLLISWGVFTRAGDFRPVEAVPDAEVLERLFRHKVLRLLQDEGAIGPEVVANLLSWKHTGFGAHVGDPIAADDARAREAVASYLAHPPVVLARIVGRGDGDRIVYRSDDIHPRHGANFRAFDPLDFIAEVVAHIPDTHEKTRMMYGWYSAKTRSWRRAQGLLPPVPKAAPAAESDRAPLSVRRSWARLVKKVYEADPLICNRCGATMRIVAFIEDPITIRRILDHLKLADAESEPARAPPPKATPVPQAHDDFYPDPPWEDIANAVWPEDDQIAG